tara:strand:+ start:273 stop:512 length:240 start_codon:yes stop_codon:yes gene_type:complete
MNTYTFKGWVTNQKQLTQVIKLENDNQARVWFVERQESYIKAGLWGAGKVSKKNKELASYLKPGNWWLNEHFVRLDFHD